MIRRYRAQDTEQLLDVWARASAVAHPFLDAGFLEREREEIRTVHLPNAETWVWDDADRVIGFMALVDNEIGAIFVDPAFHRAGIGRALVEHARALRGDLEVEVFERNEIGRGFYAKTGFQPIARRTHEPTGLLLIRLRIGGT